MLLGVCCVAAFASKIKLWVQTGGKQSITTANQNRQGILGAKPPLFGSAWIKPRKVRLLHKYCLHTIYLHAYLFSCHLITCDESLKNKGKVNRICAQVLRRKQTEFRSLLDLPSLLCRQYNEVWPRHVKRQLLVYSNGYIYIDLFRRCRELGSQLV